MLTTLSILSLDQGKIAPRFDIDAPAEEEPAPARRRFSLRALLPGRWLAGAAYRLSAAKDSPSMSAASTAR